MRPIPRAEQGIRSHLILPNTEDLQTIMVARPSHGSFLTNRPRCERLNKCESSGNDCNHYHDEGIHCKRIRQGAIWQGTLHTNTLVIGKLLRRTFPQALDVYRHSGDCRSSRGSETRLLERITVQFNEPRAISESPYTTTPAFAVGSPPLACFTTHGS